MNNLPILSATQQTAAKPAQAPTMLTATATPAKPVSSAPAKNASAPAQATAAKPATAAATQNAAEDGAAQGQSFNEVLARQVSGSSAEDDTVQTKKIKTKSAEEIFADIKGDSTAVPVAAADTTNLPAEMLAAMLPQGMNIDAKTAAPADAQPGQVRAELPGIAKAADPSAQIATTELGAGKAKSAPAAATAGAQIEAKKDAAFVGMMDKMTAAATAKLAAADEKVAAPAAAPQPNAAALAAMQTPAPLTPVGMMPTQVSINTPVTNEKWGDEFNQKITWLASTKDQTAELHLNPPQLGPMDVVLKVSGDQATALFTSPHAAVREAIEQALPKLREMMADSGIMLGNATVSDQAPRERQGEADSRSQNSRGGSVGGVADSVASGGAVARVSQINRHNGIVDTFA